ncbi:hypothetical protein ACJRO7_007181 [Eucalyptus globulus]|uniref:HMA domain-containing protein n=1 Tax=Eucalyptus globulus TaxID=34317 RepID=A0ABD3IP55_EUCGL
MKKVVIKVSMNDNTPRFCCFNLRSSRAKALRVAGGFRGVESVKTGDGKDQIEMTGNFDSVALTNLLRKKVGFAEIIAVSEADAKPSKVEDKPKEKKEPQSVVNPCHCPNPYPRSEIIVIGDPCPEPRCLFF